MSASCLLCANLNSLEILFQDDRTAIVLHEDSAVRGHAMVVWKAHVENISDLTTAEAAYLMRIYSAAERALLAATGAQRAVIMKLGIAVPHLHIHIYPVGASATRHDVMAIIDARVRETRDATFVSALRAHLDSELSGE